MSDLTTLSADELLAQLERKGSALERFEMADGPMWGFERAERGACKRAYTALCAEWTRRNQITKGE